MRTMTKSRAGRIFGRVKEIWAELDYAQRRTLEITTGIPSLTRKRPTTGTSVSELESLYALADHDGSATDTRRPIRFVRRSTGDRAKRAAVSVYDKSPAETTQRI